MSLTVNNLTVTLGQTPILQNLSLHVPAHSFFSLLGPSGCGKSTLLKTIAGLIPPCSGHIQWDGRPIDALPPEKRGFPLVFQDLRLFPHLSVLENVAFPLKMAGQCKKSRREAALHLLELVQLQGLEHRHPHQLSGGQQQRAALARALVAKPRVLLLDEPFSSLDAPLRADMRALVKQLHRRFGASMVLVTHDQEEALALSDTMAVMASGRILQAGTPRQIYERPKNLTVARHFYSGNPISGLVKDGLFSGGGIAFPAPPLFPVGRATALLPPHSLTLAETSSSAPFAVIGIEYNGCRQQITVSNGAATLCLSHPSECPVSLDARVDVSILPHKALLFPSAPKK